MKPLIFPDRRRKLLTRGAVAGVTMFAIVGASLVGGAEPPPPVSPMTAPVTPVIPAPVPPAGHHVRFQDLLPGRGGKIAQALAGTADTEVETGPELNLGDCIAIALERQPTLKAAKASIASIEVGAQSLQSFGTASTFFSPDLEIRKQQAQRGLAAASGEYQKAYNEAIQDVTRMYYTTVYAGQQGVIAEETVAYLMAMAEIIRELINSTIPFKEHGLTEEKLLVVKMGIVKAKQLRLKAVEGRKQAMAALRQAMAVDEAFAFRVKDKELPLMAQRVPITRQLVVDQALCRRPELALAAAGVDVFRLEVYAQGRLPFRRIAPTFASGVDLHAKEIPPTIRAKEYRPGGIIPEMPVQLVGSKHDRVSRAEDFALKADAVYASARSLVTLEAENAFYEFEMANENLILSTQSKQYALELEERMAQRAESIKEKDQLVQVKVTVNKVKSEYVEAVFDHLLSLAALERITAGGIRPAFPGRVLPGQ